MLTRLQAAAETLALDLRRQGFNGTLMTTTDAEELLRMIQAASAFLHTNPDPTK